MLTQQVWAELAPKWPEAYWDDWLREPANRKGRHIIRPEISRTLHFGFRGVSNAEFNEYVNNIQLNSVQVDWSGENLEYLEHDKWDDYYLPSIRRSRLVTPQSFGAELQRGVKEMRVEYRDFEHYVVVAKWAGVMGDVRANVPRGAYRGVVTLYNQGVRLHLVPAGFS
jgi:alpha-1,3-mannosyl-glycoprotein beta-1,2-N-acetylglucosaminyltransferase